MPEYAEELLEQAKQSICIRIRRRREAMNWSQEDLSIESGISQHAISEIESGKTQNPGIKTLLRLAWALGAKSEWLFSNE